MYVTLQMTHQARLHAMVWQAMSMADNLLTAYSMPTDASGENGHMRTLWFSCLELDMQTCCPPACKAAHLQKVAKLLAPCVLQVMFTFQPLKHILHAPSNIAY